MINPYMPNGLFHPYQLDESTYNLGVSGAFFYFDFIFNRISCKRSAASDLGLHCLHLSKKKETLG